MYYPILARLTKLRNMAGPFEVVQYSERWPKTFQALKARLEPALGALCRRIEHVGSTSVPGLPAKPVIDIDVVIEEDDQLEDVIERLAAIGYAFEGDQGVPGRYAFTSPPGCPITTFTSTPRTRPSYVATFCSATTFAAIPKRRPPTAS